MKRSSGQHGLRQNQRLKVKLNKTIIALGIGMIAGISAFIYMNLGDTETSQAMTDDVIIVTDLPASTDLSVSQPQISTETQRNIASSDKPRARLFKK